MSTHGLSADVRQRAEAEDLAPARAELEAFARRYGRPRDERWAPVAEELDRAIAADRELAAAARAARLGLVKKVTRRLAGLVPAEIVARYIDALVAVPRERFVLPEDIALSVDDDPLPLDRAGLATVSAPHAYLLTYGLLQVGEGDRVLELGTGTGYGAALAREIVGPRGDVVSIEIDRNLAQRARRLHDLLEGGSPSPVTLLQGDALALVPPVLRMWQEPGPPLRISVTFALREEPDWLLAMLPTEASLIAPVGPCTEKQELVRWERHGGTIRCTSHGSVRYVTERH